MNVFKARGIIIKEILAGENDKALVVILKDYGKYTVWARNCRSSKSKFLAGATLFCYADFVIYDNGKSFSLNQVDIIENFYSLTGDLDKLAYSTYFLELVEKNIQEATPINNIMLLLLKTLQVLAKSNNISPKLIGRIFELKFLQLNGYTPVISSCTHCHKNILETEKVFWNIDGVICENCRNIIVGTIKVNANILYTINYILSNTIDTLYSFNISDELLELFSVINKRLLNEHLFVKLKSKTFLEELQNMEY